MPRWFFVESGWLKLQMTTGGLTLNTGSLLNAMVNAPASTVIINASSSLIGTLTCDRLTINGGGLLRLTESASIKRQQ